MVGILVSFWDALFSGAMLVPGSVQLGFYSLSKSPGSLRTDDFEGTLREGRNRK